MENLISNANGNAMSNVQAEGSANDLWAVIDQASQAVSTFREVTNFSNITNSKGEPIPHRAKLVDISLETKTKGEDTTYSIKLKFTNAEGEIAFDWLRFSNIDNFEESYKRIKYLFKKTQFEDTATGFNITSICDRTVPAQEITSNIDVSNAHNLNADEREELYSKRNAEISAKCDQARKDGFDIYHVASNKQTNTPARNFAVVVPLNAMKETADMFLSMLEQIKDKQYFIQLAKKEQYINIIRYSAI